VSGNAQNPRQRPDKRAQRTRDRLGDALVELIQQKPFDDITVQDVLDRAEIARSTFYEHFKDKDDLFISDVDEFFEDISTQIERSGERSDRVLPVREFFDHITQAGGFVTALAASGRIHDVWEIGRAHFANGIEQRLAALPRAKSLPADQRAATAYALSGSFFGLVEWWLARGRKETPAQMDELFHRMVWNGISSGGGLRPV
jgi:AcrR family transcriptional regulator